MTETDVLIVGAGPVGLFAIFQCGMLNLRCHVVDSLPEVGGQCTALYPEKPIYDIPAFPKIEGAALIDKLARQAKPFQPVFHLGHTLARIEQSVEGGFIALTSQGLEIATRAIVIAGGAGAYVPNRPAVANITSYEGGSVLYAIKAKEIFRGKQVVIVGGGDSALDWALSLADIAADLVLVHRRRGFSAAPATVTRFKELVASARVRFKAPAQVTAIHGDGKLMSGVAVSSAGETEDLSADYLLCFLGSVASLGPIAAWGLDMEGGRIRVDPATQQTSTAGIYAIGDIAVYPNKLKLILCGFSEAAMAAHAIYKHLNPETLLVHRHSTTVGVPSMSLS